jgi:hypothetical protein
MQWFVRDSAMATPARTGGMNAEKGFEFQKSYAAWLLTRLVSGYERLAVVRYEGAQDVDLMLTDGRQIHVQVKKYARTPLDAAHVADIIESFVGDYRDARAANGIDVAEGLSFRLVAVGAVTDVLVLDVARKNNLRTHAPSLATRISAKEKPPAALKTAEVRAVLDRLDAQLFPVGTPPDMYTLLAEAELARFGVVPDRMDDALRALISRIRWREDITASVVASWLAPYLPLWHPATGSGPIRLVTGTNNNIAPQSAKGFYASQSTIWPAIFAGIDAPRDQLPAVIAAISDASTSKVLITGPSGAGKSTLARRAAWNLARQGRALVLEVVDPADASEHWAGAVKLAKQQARSGRFTLLLVDDLSDFEALIGLAADLPFDSGLKVVGTSWRSGATLQRLGHGAIDVAVGRISDREVQTVAAMLDRAIDQVPSPQLEHIQESGQLLLLNLVLLGEGSAERFADRMLNRLRTDALDLVEPYLDLCAFGRSDMSVPLSLLIRRNSHASRLTQAPEAAGLVFLVGLSRLRSGHRLLSSALIAAARVEPVKRMLQLASLADMAFPDERRFAVGVIAIAAESHEGIAAARANSGDIAKLALAVAEAADYLDVTRLERALKKIGMVSQAREIGALATEDRVRTGADASAYRNANESRDPEHTFGVLLSFYGRSDTAWGWRNFLRFCLALENNSLRSLALEQARRRLLKSDLEPADGKVIADLLTATVPPPDYAGALLLEILERFPNSVVIARAVAQSVISRVRSWEVFDALLTSASKHAQPASRARWLSQMMKLIDATSDPAALAALLQCSAQLADTDLDHLFALIGPPTNGEHPYLARARQIIARKQRDGGTPNASGAGET